MRKKNHQYVTKKEKKSSKSAQDSKIDHNYTQVNPWRPSESKGITQYFLIFIKYPWKKIEKDGKK